MDNGDIPRRTRREFLEAAARAAILVGLAAVTAALSLGRSNGASKDRCTRDGDCGTCPSAEGCPLRPEQADPPG